MPSIPLYPPSRQPNHQKQKLTSNPLPDLLHTPAGLAILEIQGTINVPSLETDDFAVDHVQKGDNLPHTRNPDTDTRNKALGITETEIGKVMFPDYRPELYGEEDMKWMKRVYLYVGKYQRLTGEVRKLGKPVAVIRRRQVSRRSDDEVRTAADGSGGDELEILEIIKYKILFPSRPEPVGLE